MSKKYYIETFGCQMNELDSEKISGNLSHQGMELVEEPSQADIIILNTCSVREKAVQKVYARLGEIKYHKKGKPDLIVGVVGCMAQLESEKVLKRAPYVNIIAGPQKGHALPELISQHIRTGLAAVDIHMEEDAAPVETSYVLRQSPWRASVTISEGCNKQCAFCIVPFARGKERNRPARAILDEIRNLVAQGYKEVILLGQTVNSYRDPEYAQIRFPELLKSICAIDALKWVRFTSPHPNDFTDELLEAMVSLPPICEHIHLPVQSGSTKVLRAMKRGYTRDKYLEKIDKIRNASRSIAISTDIIVGFPGETEQDFQDTLSLLDEVQYDSVFSFKYSPRPNTAALSLEDEPDEAEKGRRLTTLQEQQKVIQYNKNAGFVGRYLEVLVDDKPRAKFALAGRAGNNKIVNFDGPESLMGKFVELQITGFGPNSLKGALIHQGPEES